MYGTLNVYVRWCDYNTPLNVNKQTDCCWSILSVKVMSQLGAASVRPYEIQQKLLILFGLSTNPDLVLRSFQICFARYHIYDTNSLNTNSMVVNHGLIIEQIAVLWNLLRLIGLFGLQHHDITITFQVKVTNTCVRKYVNKRGGV